MDFNLFQDFGSEANRFEISIMQSQEYADAIIEKGKRKKLYRDLTFSDIQNILQELHIYSDDINSSDWNRIFTQLGIKDVSESQYSRFDF